VPTALGFIIPREAVGVRKIDTLRDSIHERIDCCDNVALLDEIDRLLDGADPDRDLLTLDEDDIRAVLSELLDE